MASEKDGGQAFPGKGMAACGDDSGCRYEADLPGMSLRDKYVDSILPALVRLSATGEVDDYTPEAVAYDAYDFADAAVAEKQAREGREDTP